MPFALLELSFSNVEGEFLQNYTLLLLTDLTGLFIEHSVSGPLDSELGMSFLYSNSVWKWKQPLLRQIKASISERKKK